MTEPRRWSAFGLRTERGVWFFVGDERSCRMRQAGTPIAVTLVEDPEGDYLGWTMTGKTDPVMVQHRKIFKVQFPYGYESEEKAGKGRSVRLRVEAM